MKTVYPLITLAVLLASLLITQPLTAQQGLTPPPPDDVVDLYGQLIVSGTQIVDQAGQPVSLAGNSLFWSNNGFGGEKYYNANVVNWLKEDFKGSIVRIPMGVGLPGGYIDDPARNQQKVHSVAEAAIAAGMYFVINWHDHNAEQFTAEAIAFYQQMAAQYGHLPHVIYEINFEPIHQEWSTIKAYAQIVTEAIRAIDPDNLIIVHTPQFSQQPHIAAADRLPDANTVYAFDFFAGTHNTGFLRANVESALAMGLPMFSPEWTTVSASGEGAVDQASTMDWIQFMQANGISHTNWAVNDKSEGASVLVQGASVAGGWPLADLTESGLLVRDIVRSYALAEPPCASIAIPGTLEAEAFSSQSGIVLEGEGIGYLDAGDWVSYEVAILEDATYTLESFLALGMEASPMLQYELNGMPLYGPVTVGQTGGWFNYQAVTLEGIDLPAGCHTFSIQVQQGPVNIDKITFTKEYQVPLVPTSLDIDPVTGGHVPLGTSKAFTAMVYDQFGNPMPNAPITWSVRSQPNPGYCADCVDQNGLFTGSELGFFQVVATSPLPSGQLLEDLVYLEVVPSEEPFSLRIEAEDYAFMSGVQTENCIEGGLNVGYLDAGDWLAYHNVSIPAAGTYQVSYRVASLYGGGSFNLEGNAGATNYGSVYIPGTGGWQNWATVTQMVELPAGTQNLGIGITGGGFNLNWLEITSASSSRTQESLHTNSGATPGQAITAYPNPTQHTLHIAGSKAVTGYRIVNHTGQEVMRGAGTTIDVQNLKSGMYLLMLETAEGLVSKRFRKE